MGGGTSLRTPQAAQGPDVRPALSEPLACSYARQNGHARSKAFMILAYKLLGQRRLAIQRGQPTQIDASIRVKPPGGFPSGMSPASLPDQ